MQRNAARPFPDSVIPSRETWIQMPIVEVQIADLVPTQYYLVIDRLVEIFEGKAPEGEDYALVIDDGKLYIVDGHHRITLALIQGKTSIHVRIFQL